MKAILFRFVVEICVWILGRKSMQSFNVRLFNLIIRVNGYHNAKTLNQSGEAWFIQNIVRKHATLCLDIGANCGDYSKYLLDHTDVRIIAFEPLPNTFLKLQNMANGYPNRIQCINKGVSDQSSELDIYYMDGFSEWASFSSDVYNIDYMKGGPLKKQLVPVISLDGYIDQNKLTGLDYIKIDTEGFEFEVLSGAQKTISTFNPLFIQIEFNRHHLYRIHSIKMISDLLPHYGLYQLLPYNGGLVRRETDSALSNIYCYATFIFIRNDFSVSIA